MGGYDVSPGGEGGGTSVHSELTGRDAADSHPVAAITDLEALLPTADQKAALDASPNGLNGGNPAASIADLPTADQRAALDGAAAPSGANAFATMADVSAPDLDNMPTSGEKAALDASPTAAAFDNPYPTMADLIASVVAYDPTTTGGDVQTPPTPANAQAALDQALTIVISAATSRRRVYEGNVDPIGGTVAPAAGDLWLRTKTSGGSTGFHYNVRNAANDGWITAFQVRNDGTTYFGLETMRINADGSLTIFAGLTTLLIDSDGLHIGSGLVGTQADAVADAVDETDIVAQFNDLLGKMRNNGLLAT